MTNEQKERPLSSERNEEAQKKFFPVGKISPEEYAAHWGDGVMCFSAANYRYADEELDAFIQRLRQILRTPGLLAQLQEEWLTPEELERVRKTAEEPLIFSEKRTTRLTDSLRTFFTGVLRHRSSH